MPDADSAGSLYILDAHGLIFQMFHGIGPMSAPDGRPTNAVFGVTRALMSLYDRGADYLIATWDHKDPTFRDKLFDQYKAHREPPPPDLLIQQPLVNQVLEAMRIPFLIAPGYEADDIMATLSSEGAGRGLDVFICSSDKDCRQLLSPKVKILNLRKGDIIDADALVKDWGVRPDQVVDFQALVGDSVDNVPGVPGVGPKTAAKWLQEYGTLDALVANADAIGGAKKSKVKDSLKEAIANGKLEQSRQLVRLDRRVPIALDWDGWRRRDWDGQRLLELFQEFGFRGFAERVRNTLRTSGAKRNSAILEDAGLASEKNQSAQPPTAPKSRKAPAKKSNTINLFSALGEEPEDDAPPTTDAATDSPEEGKATLSARPAIADDNWSYDGYRLVDTPESFAEFLENLRQQKRFVFDTETTGLDPLQSAIVGIAFAWKGGEAYYLPIRSPKEDRSLDESATLSALRPLFEDPAIAKVNQNIKYDLLVLRKHGILVQGVAGDSMVAHYLLNAGARSHNLDEMTREYLKHENISIKDLIGKKGKSQITMAEVRTEAIRRYAGEDADTAWRLAELLEARLEVDHLRPLYDTLEMPLIPVLAEMEFNGVRLDVPFLAKLSAEMETQLAGIEKTIHDLAGKTFNIASPRQLREVLFDEMRLRVQKRTGTTGEASTDQESLEKLAAQGHELPRRIIEHRQAAMLKGTYVDALPALVNPGTGRLHTSFNQTVAVTGRLSSSDPNLQNIPARTEQGKQIRQAFLPREGWTILTADYSQIELRLLAHLSGDEVLRQAFAEDRDIHTSVAASIFKVAEDAVTSDQRRMAKTVNFGVIYGMSAFGLAIRLGMPRGEAQRFIDDYFARFPRVLEYQDNLLKTALERKYVAAISGRRRKFELSDWDVKSTYRNRSQAAREAINMEIQGSAADLMKLALLRVHRRLAEENREAKMLLTVHDELVFEVPPTELRDVANLVRVEMSSAMTLNVPLRVDVAAGPNWLDVTDL